MSPDASLATLGVWGSGRVRLVCGSCAWSRTYTVDLIVRRLKARRLGDETTPIREVARHVQWPCPACRRMRWGADAGPYRRPRTG